MWVAAQFALFQAPNIPAFVLADAPIVNSPSLNGDIEYNKEELDLGCCCHGLRKWYARTRKHGTFYSRRFARTVLMMSYILDGCEVEAYD